MPKMDRNYFTFLGGEVSKNLFNRIDMQQNGKWFETAKNIYFDNTGGFLNRHGFKRIGFSVNNQEGSNIKLIPFVFNRNSSYCIELGTTYFRILKNGKFLTNNGQIIQVEHNIPLESAEDISYAQIADVLYVAPGGYSRIKTIKRLAEDNWICEDFDYDIPPMTEFNNDKSKTLSFVSQSQQSSVYYFRVEMPSNLKFGTFKNVSVVLNKVSDNTQETIFADTIHDYTISSFITDFNANQLGGHNFAITREGSTNFIRITFATAEDALLYNNVKIVVVEGQYSSLLSKQSTKVTLSSSSYGSKYSYTIAETRQNLVFSSFSYKYAYRSSGKWVSQNSTVSLNSVNTQSAMNTIYSVVYSADTYHQQNDQSLLPQRIPSAGDTINTITTYSETWNGNYYGISDLRFSYYEPITYEYTAARENYSTGEVGTGVFTVSSSGHSFFSDKQIGEVFAVKTIYSPSPNGTVKENKTYNNNNMTGSIEGIVTDPFWSNGNWRIITSGLLDGTIEMQYSYDGNIWYTHRSFTSSVRTQEGISYSTNFNEYGTIEVDDNILLRLKFSGSAHNFGIVFDTNSFENISYYKILDKTSGNQALCECIRYSVGTPQTLYQWAEASWSEYNGYPKIVFVYQNRLGFATTPNEPQTLWFSKTNDFKRFDVNVKVRDTDPITISALKPKGISDIVNVQSSKKLFVFTSDYEFAIKDEGALTQKNKELVNFTSYGSDTPETQVAANRVLFVERGGKAARELVYDIMQENYEARDVTMHFKHLFSNGNRIKSTSYVSDEYKMYLMLTEDGTLICYKYIPEQEIMACSKFVHSAGKITNVLCINGEGSTQNIYIAVDIDGYKYIEILMAGESAAYIDSYEDVTLDEASDRYQTDYFEGRDLFVVDDDGIHKVKVGTDGIIVLPKELLSFSIGFPLDAEATLIPPSVMFRDGSSTIYNKKNLYKSHITFQNSYGFLVGIKGREKFKQVYKIDKNSDIDDEITITSGTKDVVIPSSYTDENMLSFIQREPYQMYITNTELEVDYGGK